MAGVLVSEHWRNRRRDKDTLDALHYADMVEKLISIALPSHRTYLADLLYDLSFRQKKPNGKSNGIGFGLLYGLAESLPSYTLALLAEKKICDECGIDRAGCFEWGAKMVHSIRSSLARIRAGGALRPRASQLQ
jgi:hypothetical protein